MHDGSPSHTEPDEPNRPGQEDIDASRAPLMEHLVELRQRLVYSLIAFGLMFVLCFAVAKYIYDVLTWPLIWVWPKNLPDPKLIITHPLEYFFTEIKVGMFGAAVLAFPVIAMQIYKFVAPGLYKNEREAFRPYLIATPVLFIIGGMIVYFIAAPLLMKFSLSLLPSANSSMTAIELLPKVNEYLSLIMQLIFGFGVIFQLPVILSLLARAGVVNAQMLRDKRRFAIVGIFAAAAILTPPDAISMFIMALPTLVLFEASILVVARVEKLRTASAAADASQTT